MGLFGELIERIIIISPERLKFRLLNGMELAENIKRIGVNVRIASTKIGGISRNVMVR